MSRRGRRAPRLACEAVRPLLPELAEGAPHEAGPVEVHIATCPSCFGELARYRRLIEGLGGLREVVAEPPPGLVESLLVEVLPTASRLRPLQRVASVAANPRVMLSVGGAVVGATAIGLLWWRTARRGLPPPAASVVAARLAESVGSVVSALASSS